MKKESLILKEMCEQSYGVFCKHGYTPKYCDESESEFECEVNGAKFSYVTFENGGWYSASFCFDHNISDELKRSLEDEFMKIEPENVTFENLHVLDREVCLSSAFMTDMFELEMIELAIKTLENENGIARLLRDIQKS